MQVDRDVRPAPGRPRRGAHSAPAATAAARLIMVSNRLPVTLTPAGAERSAGGLVSALAGLPADAYSTSWLGWPGKEVPPHTQRAVADDLARDHGCTPVFLPDDLARDHYEGLSNASIWPLFHSLPTYFQYRTEWWDAYRAVNQAFADRVLDTAADGDMVWVHDYQLMLLPRMLKRARPSLRVGFFLHTPFPSSDTFRCHPNREELLAGVLGADLIGFHTFGYLRHFRSTALRLLGVDSEMTTVHHDGHTSALGVYPIGIDAQRFEAEMQTPAFHARCADTAAAYAGKRVVLSVERLDYTKGIVRRLDAIDLFLSRLTPAQRDGVRFVFVSVPTRAGVDRYRELRETVEHRIGRINGQYATLHDSPVHFLHRSVDFTDLCALYALADVALVTPLVDGMNLVAKEYVACQRDEPACAAAGGAGAHRTGPGVLVLSEFAGAAQELPNALTVNPYDVPGIADAIAAALAMPADERARRMRPMRDRVFTYDAATWSREFVDDLAAAPRPAPVATSVVETADTAGAAADAHKRLAAAVAAGQRVALFLDYDGTLREIVTDPEAARPTPEIHDLLRRLAALPAVDLTVISGRTAADLAHFLGAHPNLGLVAEHGAEYRAPGQHAWRPLGDDADLGWKDQVLHVFRLYQRSTPGTHVEVKRTGLVWHYRRADPEFGRWKANQLVDELSIVAANHAVEIRHGRKIVEASSAHVNKGAAVRALLAHRPYDLVLLAGDDTTDESMFQLAAHDPRVLTLRIGDGQTRARHRLPTPAALRHLLKSLRPPRG
jgi:trehalose 6-phosphate synthase/phosphatase